MNSWKVPDLGEQVLESHSGGTLLQRVLKVKNMEKQEAPNLFISFYLPHIVLNLVWYQLTAILEWVWVGILTVWSRLVWKGWGGDYTRMYCLEEAGGTLENPELYCGANAWAPGGPVIKNHLPMQETQDIQVQSLGWGDALEWKWQPTPVFFF